MTIEDSRNSFIGRVRETKKIISSLEKKNNVILTGKYGIGRTSLVRNVVAILEAQWKFVFVDFSKTPGEMTQKIAADLIFSNRRKEDISYKKTRSLLNYASFTDMRTPVIVLDNIASITNQKISFLEYLAFGKRFSFIAITESFLSEQSLFRLRSMLFPSDFLRLGYLCRKDMIGLFQNLSKKHKLNWDETHIKKLSSSMNGYPLSIKDLIKRECQKKTE